MENEKQTFADKYKNTFALIAGTVCLIIACYAPAKSALLLTSDDIPWKTSNYIFLVLGIIFLWGQIVSFAKSVQDGASKFIHKKTD